jgi:acetyl-CoA acetyltransferase
MTDRSFADRVAIVGLGSTDFHTLYRQPDPTITAYDSAVRVAVQALEDSGLEKADLDGLAVSGFINDSIPYQQIAHRLGLQEARYVQTIRDSARSLPSQLGHAAMAIMHGMANSVLFVHSINPRTTNYKFGANLDNAELYDHVYGMASPGAWYAMALSRYLALYNGSEEELGAVAVAFRKWASMNPLAIMKDRSLSIEDYLNTRYVTKPMRLVDYCLVNDGAIAFILTSAERGRDLKQPPVYLTSVTQQGQLREQYASEDFWFRACGQMRESLLYQIGLDISHVDTLQVYDNFSPTVLWGLEGFGWAPQGDALRWIQDGRLGPDGELPTNTSGGMLSEAYMMSWNQHAEMVRQLRGQAGPRQVENCNRAMYYGLSMVPGASLLSSAATVGS